MIWNWVQFLQEATYFIIFLPLRGAIDCRREFKEVLKYLSKRNWVRLSFEIGYRILG